MRFFEQRIGLFAHRVALGILGAIVHKANARLFNTADFLGIKRAEIGELEQVFRRAFGVRARVHQHHLSARARHHRRKRRTADTLDALAKQRCARKQRAGRTCGHNRVRLAVFHQL